MARNKRSLQRGALQLVEPDTLGSPEERAFKLFQQGIDAATTRIEAEGKAIQDELDAVRHEILNRCMTSDEARALVAALRLAEERSQGRVEVFVRPDDAFLFRPEKTRVPGAKAFLEGRSKNGETEKIVLHISRNDKDVFCYKAGSDDPGKHMSLEDAIRTMAEWSVIKGYFPQVAKAQGPL